MRITVLLRQGISGGADIGDNEDARAHREHEQGGSDVQLQLRTSYKMAAVKLQRYLRGA